MTKARKGVYAATITPMMTDGTPDAEKLARYALRVLGEGLDGVAPCGTTGEGTALPMAARVAFPEVFAKAGVPNDRVIFGTGACATDDAVALTRACTDAGFNNVLVLPPFYMKNVSDEGLYAYYARLIDRVGTDRLRVYLYHFPALSMTPISVPLIQRLKAEFGPVIAGLKDSSGDLKGTLDFVDAADDFDVFPSTEAFLLDGMAKGCAGVISATTNCSAALARQTLDTQDAEAQALLTRVREVISGFPLSAAIKQIEAWKSGDETWCDVFAPLTRLSDDQTQSLRTQLEALPAQAGVLKTVNQG